MLRKFRNVRKSRNVRKREKTPETDTDTDTDPELDRSLQEARSLQLSALKKPHIATKSQQSLKMTSIADDKGNVECTSQ